MRDSTFAVAAGLAALLPVFGCSSGGDGIECDAFRGAGDCARDAVRRASGGGQGQPPPFTSGPGEVGDSLGPTAGEVGDTGPSAGATGGAGPTAGPVPDQAGPSPGQVAGAPATPGSLNPTDPLSPSDGGGCGSLCGRIAELCGALLDAECPGLAARFEAGCNAGCSCTVASAPACYDAIVQLIGPCLNVQSCEGFVDCLDSIEDSAAYAAGAAACEDSPAEDCGVDVECPQGYDEYTDYK